MVKEHLKKCSTSLVIKEMKIKLTLRFYLTPIRMPKIKNSGDYRSLARMWRKGNMPALLVGLETATTLKIILAVLQKTGNRST